MTSITIELEERHLRLKFAEERRSTGNLMEIRPDAEPPGLQRRFSRNYGVYNSTRYAGRMIGLASGAYYKHETNFQELFLIYTLATLLLLLFIFIYFHELIVASAHKEDQV